MNSHIGTTHFICSYFYLDNILQTNPTSSTILINYVNFIIDIVSYLSMFGNVLYLFYAERIPSQM
jgi:hypothetical protein